MMAEACGKHYDPRGRQEVGRREDTRAQVKHSKAYSQGAISIN